MHITLQKQLEKLAAKVMETTYFDVVHGTTTKRHMGRKYILKTIKATDLRHKIPVYSLTEKGLESTQKRDYPCDYKVTLGHLGAHVAISTAWKNDENGGPEMERLINFLNTDEMQAAIKEQQFDAVFGNATEVCRRIKLLVKWLDLVQKAYLAGRMK